MKVNLDIIEITGLIQILERRRRKMWFHRMLNPNCRMCRNELITIKKLNNSLEGTIE